MAYRGAIGGIGRGTPPVNDQNRVPGGLASGSGHRNAENSASRGRSRSGNETSRRGNGCYICNEASHFARDCPYQNQRGQDGHESAQYNQQNANADIGAFAAASHVGFGDNIRHGACKYCKLQGYAVCDCPNKRDNTCRNCGEEGHFFKDCPKPRKERNNKCFNCGVEGHFSKDCPEPPKERSNNCYNCGEVGHFSRDCPEPQKKSLGRNCYRCGGDDHFAIECTLPDPSGPIRRRTRSEGEPKLCLGCNGTDHKLRECPFLTADDIAKLLSRGPPDYVPEEELIDDLWHQHIPMGEQFDKYFDIPVEYVGEGEKLAPCESLESAKFPKQLIDNVKSAGYTRLTPIQMQSIPYLMNNCDIMGMAPTGSGKTAAYLLPVVTYLMTEKNLPQVVSLVSITPLVLILAPTRELTKQIKNEARKFLHGTSFQVTAIYGGTAINPQKDKLKSGCHILVACPGRLIDWMNKGFISLSQCKYLILDEADRLLNMGFEPEIRRMFETSEIPPKGIRRTLMFSATFPFDIQKLANDFMHKHVMITIGKVGATNHDIDQVLEKVDGIDKKTMLLKLLDADKLHKGKLVQKTIVFVERKRTADFLACLIGTKAVSIHGDRFQREREEALAMFNKVNGETSILVATDVCARGLNIIGVDHVINYDLPKTIDEYVHRIGRTGRVGNFGLATSFYDPGTDQELAKDLKEMLEEACQDIPGWLLEEIGRPRPERGEREGGDQASAW